MAFRGPLQLQGFYDSKTKQELGKSEYGTEKRIEMINSLKEKKKSSKSLQLECDLFARRAGLYGKNQVSYLFYPSFADS